MVGLSGRRRVRTTGKAETASGRYRSAYGTRVILIRSRTVFLAPNIIAEAPR